jgi:hypothetical protein
VLTGFRGRSASSKADIFEAKVASAVDEANSSDSEETFVYESNPPEPTASRPGRYHSRTPSVSSMVSQAEQYAARFRTDGHQSVAGKKSMKFASNAHHLNGTHSEGADSGPPTGGSGRASGGHASHHHHIGRYGRGGGHASLFDSDSPFPGASKSPRAGASNGSRLSPRPQTPRSSYPLRHPASGKSLGPVSYDLEGEGADDERTPLMGSVRSGRTRNSRRPPNPPDPHDKASARGCWRRVAGCLFLAGLVALLIAAVVAALVVCSKPLHDIHIRGVENVLVSEQEIMFDLHVHAVNPNLVAIQIGDLDINVFAKSKYIGSSYAGPGRHGGYRATDGIDEGNDPIEDPDSDSQTMLLGRILDFDSPLVFEASPLHHRASSSTGEVRLTSPGNSSTVGGSDRWARVIQHPFELVVKGVLHYSLPISSRIHSANIAGNVTVQPDTVGADDPPDPERQRRTIGFTA